MPSLTRGTLLANSICSSLILLGVVLGRAISGIYLPGGFCLLSSVLSFLAVIFIIPAVFERYAGDF
jgi:hypothetical protein